MKSLASYGKFESIKNYRSHHYTQSRSERLEKSNKFNMYNLTVPSGMAKSSVTCVTAHGQEFSITLTFGIISVKYSQNGKNTYHYEVSDIIGMVYDTRYLT